MKNITDAGELRDKRVLVRTSFNVPVQDGQVTNSFRIKRALTTLRYLRESGAKTIILAHIGREKNETLKPVYNELEKFMPVQWGGVIGSEEFNSRVALMSRGDVLVAENLRQDDREKANDVAFAKEIAAYGDLYVNDAFDNVHREHASMSALAKLLPAYAGLNIGEEIRHLKRVMEPEHPALFMLGGAKFETKIPLIEKYLDDYDHVFVAGALANDIFKAKGYEVGTSLVSDVSLNEKPFLSNAKLLIPVDVVVEGPQGTRTIDPRDVQPDEKIYDCGPKTVAMLKSYIDSAKTVLWNGPFGNYEAGFEEATEAIVRILAEAPAFSVVGGGDTVGAIEKLDIVQKLGFVSTGGGAMLTFLEYGSTPVLDLLE
jgi:phosphoglycerate kinase